MRKYKKIGGMGFVPLYEKKKKKNTKKKEKN
jgi:hypothetical protein